MSAIYNDGQLPYGSRLLIITGSAPGSCVAETIEFTLATTALRRTDQLGNPSGQVLIKDWTTGTATLQLATTNSQVPATGDTFSTVRSGSAERFVITNVGQPESSTTDKKVTISFCEVINE